MSNHAILNIKGEEHKLELGKDRVLVFNNSLFLNDEIEITRDNEFINIVRSEGVAIDLSNHPYRTIRVAFSTRVVIIISDTPYEKIIIDNSDVTIITKKRSQFE